MTAEMDEKTVKTATMVIIHSGNARVLVNDAIKAISHREVNLAHEKLEQANEEIHSAHTIQTDVIQEEARGNPLQLSMLLTHAQDTLMVAMSEVNMAKHIIALHQRIIALEDRLNSGE
jgi:PTS system cellobiose-specific IIA component